MTARQPDLANEIAEDLLEWVANGQLRPHISARYGLDQASEALRSLIDRKAIGKLVIEP
jgi:NADPH2:quinone reductase